MLVDGVEQHATLVPSNLRIAMKSTYDENADLVLFYLVNCEINVISSTASKPVQKSRLFNKLIGWTELAISQVTIN
jgi:hypothetical protein